eukprot:scaffold95180_cov20-Tisochrysis_lutea.AAC.3
MGFDDLDDDFGMMSSMPPPRGNDRLCAHSYPVQVQLRMRPEIMQTCKGAPSWKAVPLSPAIA